MEKRDALISIIVPVYGTEAYLPACIESIQNQTYKNIQIILVDDGSPDKCSEICDEYAKSDDRITVIHQKNKGVSGARNSGMASARGKYIMFVDSDDELYPCAVEILLNDATACNADVVSALMDSGENYASTEKNKDRKIFEHNSPLLLSLSGDPNTESACAKLFKVDFIKGVCFEEGKNIHEDGFFLFKCYLKNPVLVQHDVVVYQYNFRKGSSSRQKFSDKYLSMIYFCEEKKKIVSDHYPQFMEHVYNMEARTNLQVLDVLCSTTDKKYKALQKKCIKTFRSLRMYHKPISKHHKQLDWIVTYGLYPLYKRVVKLKYYR